jgi:hypothetical protein
MSEHLTPAELAELTGSGGRIAQARWLQSKRVPYRFTGDKLLVLRVLVRELDLMQRDAALPRLDLVG